MLLFSCFTVTVLLRLVGLKTDTRLFKNGEKQDNVFSRSILERNESIQIPRSHTSLVPVIFSARYLVQPYLTDFLVTHNREINGELTVSSGPSSTPKFSRYKQAGGGDFIPATL